MSSMLRGDIGGTIDTLNPHKIKRDKYTMELFSVVEVNNYRMVNPKRAFKED